MVLKGKVAAITGGTKGIGRGIAEAFLKEGARVAISSRSKEHGEAILREIAAGDRLIYVESDASKREDVDRFLDETERRLGPIDIVVNNVAGSTPAPLAEMTDENWHDTLALSLSSAFYGTRRALQLMIPRRSGRVINIGSAAAKTAFAGLAAYTSAKHGLLGLTRSAALEAGEHGITVNAICPGPIVTDMARGAAAALGITVDQFFEPVVSRGVTKKLNTTQEIGAVAVLLASEAGAGITGTAISVDGGIALD
jgi:NAD(P)-dependent dehydrogenase (short-subunit alcohol dehydrogenase family)